MGRKPNSWFDSSPTLWSEEDYKAALARAYALMDAEIGSPEGEELVALAGLIEKYEELHVKLD